MPLPVRIILHEIQWSAKQFFPPYFLNHSSDARVPEDPPSPARGRQADLLGQMLHPLQSVPLDSVHCFHEIAVHLQDGIPLRVVLAQISKRHAAVSSEGLLVLRLIRNANIRQQYSVLLMVG